MQTNLNADDLPAVTLKAQPHPAAVEYRCGQNLARSALSNAVW